MSYDPESDLKTLEAMTAHLTPYLYESELYGSLGPNQIRLTLGGLMLRLERLLGLYNGLNPAQQQRVQTAQKTFEQMRGDWRTHYESKIVQEIKSRLSNYSAFLDDYRDDNASAQAGYPAEATHRTILHYLQAEARRLNLWELDLGDRLTSLDNGLHRIIKAQGKFLWDEGLKQVYPEKTFWWLYGLPAD